MNNENGGRVNDELYPTKSRSLIPKSQDGSEHGNTDRIDPRDDILSNGGLKEVDASQEETPKNGPITQVISNGETLPVGKGKGKKKKKKSDPNHTMGSMLRKDNPQRVRRLASD